MFPTEIKEVMLNAKNILILADKLKRHQDVEHYDKIFDLDYANENNLI